MQSRCCRSGFFFAGLLKLILDLLRTHGNFLKFPPPIFRSGVLRQGAMNPIR